MRQVGEGAWPLAIPDDGHGAPPPSLALHGYTEESNLMTWGTLSNFAFSAPL